jgi:putative sterol carrier protein
VTLGEYVRLLVETLGRSDRNALARLRSAVADRSARITLDDESVDVWFAGEELSVEPAPARDVDGEGATDTPTVLDLMDGYLEPREAILEGRLDVSGAAEDVHRIFVAIEILLDAAPRSPALQDLVRQFRADPSRPRRARPMPASGVPRPYPPRAGPEEEELLRRLGLLPTDPP